MKRALLSIAAITMLACPAAAQDIARADILGADGGKIGEATFTQGTIGAMAEIRVSKLPPGSHGMHIHAMGMCDHEEGFTTATGHVTSNTDKKHGYLNPEGPELGDLPNIIVHEDGTANVELFLPQLDVAGEQGALLDVDGSALMIHEKPDDHMTQPIGGSGPRIACGIIQSQ